MQINADLHLIGLNNGETAVLQAERYLKIHSNENPYKYESEYEPSYTFILSINHEPSCTFILSILNSESELKFQFPQNFICVLEYLVMLELGVVFEAHLVENLAVLGAIPRRPEEMVFLGFFFEGILIFCLLCIENA
jgi:hypothetical protein